MDPKTVIPQFDKFLLKHKANFEAVVVGGAALSVMGIIQRATRDCDILDPKIPSSIQKLAKKFSADMRKGGVDIKDEWLNNGPDSLLRVLPPTWRDNIQEIYRGKALTLFTLERNDLLKTKLFALCDREEIDRQDLLALKPTRAELLEALPCMGRKTRR